MSKGQGKLAIYSGGILIGLGLGGFIDGIVFHQILQWHHMLSSLHPPTTMEAMQLNMVWDGLFHLVVWVATLAGVLLVWNGARKRPVLPGKRFLLGLMLIGWGVFNFTEGLINHHILEIHHVRGYGPSPVWDVAFLLSGPVLVALGWVMARRARLAPATEQAHPQRVAKTSNS